MGEQSRAYHSFQISRQQKGAKKRQKFAMSLSSYRGHLGLSARSPKGRPMVAPIVGTSGEERRSVGHARQKSGIFKGVRGAPVCDCSVLQKMKREPPIPTNS